MISKDEWQSETLDKWRKYGGKATVVAVTGVGKSVLLEKAATKRLEFDSTSVVHYIVHSKLLKKQVKDKIDPRVEVHIINSYIKKKRKCDLLLVDECDLMGATTFSKIFSICEYKFILCVTASLERADGKHALIQKYAPVISNVGFAEALSNKWICDFEVINLRVQRPAGYDQLSNSFRSDFAFFHDDMKLMFSCMSYPGAMSFIRENRLNIQPGEVIGVAKRCRKAMQERNELIYESEEKLVKAKELIFSNPGKKIITFSMSKRFGNKLTEEVPNSVCIDSDMKDKERDQLIIDYVEGKYRILNSIKIFERGFDSPEVDMGICISTTAVDRRMKQILGRILRFKEGKKAIMYCLYLDRTKEISTLKKAQEEIPNVRWI